MANEGCYVALGLSADTLFGGLSPEEILREIAPGRNRLLYLLGASHSRKRRDAPAIIAGRTTSSRV
jgi:hypothetical protein